ncbi:MAG: crotonase/enoyl-CoA hydratase family protein [Burkholderiales bacterium]|nr:crotonase/enoyl-CoA hydratase family protein [Burkholderiales bacterium]
MAEEVIVEVRDAVQVIRINRPEKKNALKGDMYDRISEALTSGDASGGVAAHVFLGSNGVFTAGNDISDFAKRARTPHDNARGAPAFIRLLPKVKKPMIAAVDGLAVGIGTTMLFHCDLVYASPEASLHTPFVDLGIVPEAGSSLLAPMQIGYRRAFELLCLGEPFDAQHAFAAGLVNRIVPSGELESVAIRAATRLAMKPPGALAAARRLLRGDSSRIEAQVKKETEVFAERLGSAEAREAFNAFLEKRQPDFTRFRVPS